MGVNHADIFAVIFCLDEAFHDLFTLTTGEVAGLRTDDLNVWCFGDGLRETFLTVDSHARPDGALQLNHVTRLAIHLLHQPVTNQFAFQHVIGGDGGHIERFVFYVDGTVKQEDRNFSIFGFLQHRLPARGDNRGNKDGIHALSDKRAHRFNLVLLLLLTIGDFQRNTALFGLTFRHIRFSGAPARFRSDLRKSNG